MLSKNDLGYNCLIFGFFFFWNYLVTRRQPKSRERREETLHLLALFG